MVTIATCSGIDEANLLRMFLESNGISALVLGEFSDFSWPIRIQVSEQDEATAREIVEQYRKKD
jgi:hypothetical protein